MAFKDQVPVAELLTTSPFYDANNVQIVEDFYCGGSRMNERKLVYLRPRQSDANPQYLRSRFNAQYYTNYFGPKLNDIAGNIVACPPVVSVADATDPRAAYWASLNTNCNGLGGDLKSVVFSAILEMLKHLHGGWLAVTFPPIAPPADNSLAAYKGAGVLDGRISSLPADTVDDWQETNGVLDWVRTHTIEYERATPTSGVVRELHKWTYYAADGIYVYSARKNFYQQYFKITGSKWDDKQTATLQKLPNYLGRCPVFRLASPPGFTLGDSLVPTAQALFNREAAREFAIDSSALALPILITDKSAEQVPVSELCVLNVGIGGDMKYIAAPAQVFEAMKVACDDLRAQFDRSIAALADRAADQPQNARQSADAKELDREPKDVLLSLYEEPAIDALQSAISSLSAVRGDDPIGPKLTGMNAFTGQSAQDLIEETTEFLSVPGIDRSPTACRMALRDLIFARLPGLSPLERKAIESELAAKVSAIAAPAIAQQEKVA